jgi:TPR repeat protein
MRARLLWAFLVLGTAPAVASAEEPDIGYGAYQRGYYIAAFREATKRVEEKSDPKSMTLLGELYSDGLGVPNDDKKAAEWYRLAASHGDREAAFQLAMFKMTGRGGPADRPGGAKLLEQAAQLGHVLAAYDLALIYLEGQLLPQNIGRAVELMQMAANAGSPEAQYALATFYKEGRGVPKDPMEAARLLGLAARSGNVDAMVEYGIALFNGTGVAKSEQGAVEYLMKAAKRGSAPAQTRLALMYANGRGVKADPVEAARWHLIARAGGDNDPNLDAFMAGMTPADRAMAENRAKPWIASMSAIGPTPFPAAPAKPAKAQVVKP